MNNKPQYTLKPIKGCGCAHVYYPDGRVHSYALTTRHASDLVAWLNGETA